MISDSILILIVLATVFIAGAAIGQLWLRIKLAKLERSNQELENRRIMELKRLINAKAVLIERGFLLRKENEESNNVSPEFGMETKPRVINDEIDQILGEIENLS